MCSVSLAVARQPSPKVAVLLRAKSLPARADQLRCRRCGSQTYARVVNGAVQCRRGPTGGTVVYACICYDCLMSGITVPMIWDVQSITPEGN